VEAHLDTFRFAQRPVEGKGVPDAAAKGRQGWSCLAAPPRCGL
jgi:hypothetical protein